MKNLAHVFVVVLALTGAAAAAARTTIISHQSSSSITAVKASAFPIPVCPPDDPNGCGIAGPNVAGQE